MNPKRVGFLIYPGMQALDLAGPMDAFAAVSLADGKGRRLRMPTSSYCGLRRLVTYFPEVCFNRLAAAAPQAIAISSDMPKRIDAAA